MSDQETTHMVGVVRCYLDEICYLSRRYRYRGQAADSEQAQLGRVVFHVQKTLSDVRDPYNAPELTEGAATILPVGTAVHEVTGFPQERRLAAVWGGRLHLYDA